MCHGKNCIDIVTGKQGLPHTASPGGDDLRGRCIDEPLHECFGHVRHIACNGKGVAFGSVLEQCQKASQRTRCSSVIRDCANPKRCIGRVFAHENVGDAEAPEDLRPALHDGFATRSAQEALGLAPHSSAPPANKDPCAKPHIQ